MSSQQSTIELLAWRHPRPGGAQGRCIGSGTDLPVDIRQAKSLAHQIRHCARRHGLPRVVFTSPLARCMAVGRHLKRWGWVHHADPRLREMHFGDWDGLPWEAIAREAVDAWMADFAAHAPGGGECLNAVLARVSQSLRTLPRGSLIVTHGGWITAAQWLCSGEAAQGPPDPGRWPKAPSYASCTVLTLDSCQGVF